MKEGTVLSAEEIEFMFLSSALEQSTSMPQPWFTENVTRLHELRGMIFKAEPGPAAEPAKKPPPTGQEQRSAFWRDVRRSYHPSMVNPPKDVTAAINRQMSRPRRNGA